MEKQLYTKDFYDSHIEGSIISAREIIPLVLNFIQPKSIVDVGCGVGTWLSVFRELGVEEYLGIDGDYVDKSTLLIPQDKFLSADLKKPLKIDKKFDLVVSLEVAEHLPEDCVEIFVNSVTQLGSVILFSAAIPFQGGTGHLNEQWQYYWVQHFQKQGYLVADCLREKIWNNHKVMPWYAQNIFIFIKEEYLKEFSSLAKEVTNTNHSQINVVHPNIYLNILRYLRTRSEHNLNDESPSTTINSSNYPLSKNSKKPILSSCTNLNVSISQPIKPRIDVVLQATGIHGWSFSHGWLNVLQKEGLLHHVFKPVADFAAEEPKYDDGLFEYLNNPQADIILLLGFDWHSQPLHKSLKWQEQWRKAPIKKIALLQECYSAEVVQSTYEWKLRMQQAINSTVSCVDGLICHHEPDMEFLQKQENIFLPITFIPFYIDSEYFKNKVPFEKRANRALFRGKAPQYFTEKTYDERRQLIDVLGRCKDVDLFQLQADLLYINPAESVESYISELNSYKIHLNLPSLAPTLTVRPFEVMGCGGLLLQNKVVGDKSSKLFQDWEHLVYYDANNPDDLISKIQYLTENSDIAKKIAKQGYHLCHEQHTIQSRIQEIIAWTDNSCKETFNNTLLDLSRNSLEVKDTAVGIGKVEPTVIVDGVFFQLYKTGIARVWKSLLEQWVDNGFAKHIVVLDRAGTTPKISGIKYRSIPAYDYSKTDADREMIQQVCDEEGADLFISSYYTTPLSTPSVFLAHDMIPELMGADLNHPMWREKHYGIAHATKYISVSENTAKDLVKFFPDIPLRSITFAQNGIDHKIFHPASSETINLFKTKYGISKPYFILVGASGGYKNTILFFKAFAQLYSSQGFDIVCTGSGFTLEADYRAYTSGSTVHLLQLSDEELSIAYSGAVALVYPSKYEGFGLPVLEAIACGCPVITCPNASIPEVTGEAALYVNDEDVDGLSNALCDVQKPNIRNSLIAAGLEQAKKFSWSKMAEAVISAVIDATLLPLNLKDINLVIFPDWSQSEETLCLELEQVIKAIAMHPDSSKTTILIDNGNISEEEAALIISSVSMNLLMQEELDISEGLEISFLGQLGEIQWKALLPRIQARIVLENENQEAIALFKAENIPSRQIKEILLG